MITKPVAPPGAVGTELGVAGHMRSGWRFGRWWLAACVLLFAPLGSVATAAAELEVLAARLEEQVQRQVHERRTARAVAWAVMLHGRVRRGHVAHSDLAELAARAQARYELGSITKTLTAWLLAAEVAAGRVRWSTTLAELRPDPTLPPGIGAITLEALARHRSGLPRLSTRPIDLLRGVLWSRSDPYAGSTVEEVWAALAAVDPGDIAGQPGYVYSNLGYAVLGQALARAAGRDYPELLQQRVLAVHGLGGMRLSVSGRRDPDLLPGTGSNGLEAAPWHLDAYAPAGGLTATLADVIRYAEILLDAPPDLAPLLAPPEGLIEDRVVAGLGFHHRRLAGMHVRWHNGGTGGFRSFLAVVPERRLALILLGSTTIPLDPVAWHVLDPSQPKPETEARWVAWLVVLPGLLLAPLAAVFVAARGIPGDGGPRPADGLAYVDGGVQLLFLVLLTRPLGDWSWVPIGLWWAVLIVTVAAVGIAWLRFLHRRPWNRSGGARFVRVLGGWAVYAGLLSYLYLA